MEGGFAQTSQGLAEFFSMKGVKENYLIQKI